MYCNNCQYLRFIGQVRRYEQSPGRHSKVPRHVSGDEAADLSEVLLHL